jgi:3-oxoacyl-[acyl-carrier protein] reductase
MEGSGHVVLPTDLSELDDIGSAVREAARQLDGLDGLAHAAGAHATTPLRNVQPTQVRSLFDLNVGSAVMVAKAFRHKTVRRPGASLVLMSSAVGVVGQPGVSVYSATKGAIQSLTKSLALELARDQIRVNCVAPGVVRTPMTESIKTAIGEAGFDEVTKAHPLGLGEPDDVAAAVLFLLSSSSKWITGTSLAVDGGYTAQ